MTALFTAKVTAKGGRSGHVTSDDGVLDHNIVMPNEKKKANQGQILNSSLRRDTRHASAAHWSMSQNKKALTSILRLRAM